MECIVGWLYLRVCCKYSFCWILQHLCSSSSSSEAKQKLCYVECLCFALFFIMYNFFFLFFGVKETCVWVRLKTKGTTWLLLLLHVRRTDGGNSNTHIEAFNWICFFVFFCGAQTSGAVWMRACFVQHV